MKKRFVTAALTVMTTAALSMTAFAGQWLQNSTGWWYDNGNGTWPANTWMWIDGNNDGVAESYYFDQFGYCMMNTTTPDGYTVDGNGAWTVNGVVQTRSTAGTAANVGQQVIESNVEPVNLSDLDPVAYNLFSRKRSNVKTSQNALWGHAMSLQEGGYAEFFTDGKYNWLTLTYAPASGFRDDADYSLNVYGDDDKLLASYDFDYKTDPTDVSVNIAGQKYVKLYLERNKGSFYQVLYMKNAQFK